MTFNTFRHSVTRIRPISAMIYDSFLQIDNTLWKTRLSHMMIVPYAARCVCYYSRTPPFCVVCAPECMHNICMCLCLAYNQCTCAVSRWFCTARSFVACRPIASYIYTHTRPSFPLEPWARRNTIAMMAAAAAARNGIRRWQNYFLLARCRRLCDCCNYGEYYGHTIIALSKGQSEPFGGSYETTSFPCSNLPPSIRSSCLFPSGYSHPSMYRGETNLSRPFRGCCLLAEFRTRSALTHKRIRSQMKTATPIALIAMNRTIHEKTNSAFACDSLQ